MSILLDPLVVGTKLTPPRYAGATVFRSKLFESFYVDQPLPLNTIIAPAGFGKSTLAVQWIDQLKLPVAWYSIDKEDNDPIRWMRHFIAAIHSASPEFKTSLLDELNSTSPSDISSLIPRLLNKIGGLLRPIVFVLDDYHFIQNEQIHDLLHQILTYQPVQLSLVITSRSELPFALSKLRTKRLIHEIDGNDLRFSFSETAEFFRQIACLDLGDDDISILEERTEGWATGIQLAALSLKHNSNKKQFIQAFDSDDIHIMNYLTEQIINHLGEEEKSFLIKTSIL
ncbi:MAG: hypothetical protein P8166_10170, partial [Candidatus Thiodiazotropha sp.]